MKSFKQGSKPQYPKFFLALACVLFFSCSLPSPAQAPPSLRKQGSAQQLIVEGKPFLILGGELHNSSSSSLDYMKPIWPRLADLNLNTVLPAVSWELLEPVEGKFDFTLVDGLLSEARAHHLKLVLLWFGSWKNGVSSYAPGWVKTNLTRFPRVLRKDGTPVEILSPVSHSNRDADTKAFAALMKHLQETDSRHQTVIMVQVENEAGILGDSRDHSRLAEEKFAQPVPAELMKHLSSNKENLIPEFARHWEGSGYKAAGTWTEVFGEGADEAFMAWHMASYIGHVAAGGRAERRLPMFANAWLVQNPNQKAGQYPSGGPVSKVMDIWQAAAPDISFLAPDIYLPDFDGVCASYSRGGNALFIPETGGGPSAAANAFTAIGKFNAIGFCPFGIDSMKPENPLKDAYRLLQGAADLIAGHAGMGEIFTAAKGKEDRLSSDLAGYRVELAFKPQNDSPSYGMVIHSGPDEFFVMGTAIEAGFSGKLPGPRHTRILSIDEGEFRAGKWIPGRRMNGDENSGGWRVKLPAGPPSAQRVKLYRHD